MKTLVMITSLAVAGATVAVPGSAHAQTYGVRAESAFDDRRNLLLFNPGDLINGIVSVEYERALLPFFGLAFGLSVNSFRGAFTPASGSSYIAVGPEVAARFHFIQDAPAGLWIGPSIGAAYIASRSGFNSNQVVAWGVGAAIGYNFILFRHFALQIGVGGGFTDFGDGLSWAPRFRLGIGGAF